MMFMMFDVTVPVFLFHRFVKVFFLLDAAKLRYSFTAAAMRK